MNTAIITTDKNRSKALENEPQQPNGLTHSMVMRILSNDGSVKELVFRFCQTDQWSNAGAGFLANAETIASYIIPIISRDKKAVGVMAEIRDLATLNTVHMFKPYVLKPEYLFVTKNLNPLQVNFLN